jgi:hypothetical protein
MRRQLFLLPVIATVLGAGGIGGIAVAGAESDGHLLHASTTTSGQEIYDIDLSTGACTHQDQATGRCAIPLYETDHFTGDLVGQEQETVGLSVTIPAIVGQATGIATYSGTVKGCPGPGTALFRYEFTMGVDGQTGHNRGTVDVVPGSGTGGLSTLRGHGVDDAHQTPSGVVSAAQLDFSCHNGHDD